MPINIQAAREIALRHATASADIPIDIIDAYTIERSYGWVFFYNSRAAIAGDPLMGLGGNGPLVVLAESGIVHELPTSRPFNEALAAFEQHHRLVL